MITNMFIGAAIGLFFHILAGAPSKPRKEQPAVNKRPLGPDGKPFLYGVTDCPDD